MTQEEIDKLQIGDVIFDMSKKEAYHLVKIEDGCVYYEGTPHWGSIPKRNLLDWNIVSLMRDRVVYCKDAVRAMTPYVKQIQEVLLQMCPGGSVTITKDWWKFNENKEI